MSLQVNDYDTADVFLSMFRDLVWEPRQKIFRGQANAVWDLTPSAFREKAEFPTDTGMETLNAFTERTKQESDRREFPPPPDFDAIADLEAGTLARFFEAADAAGLPLPEDSQVIRATIKHSLYLGFKWPQRELRSILALAQHHGLPTRLLDWTWDWRVAAFFAARGILLSKETPPERFAVWSLDANLMETEQLVRSLGLPGKKREKDDFPYTLEVVTAPSATNANLRAQKGLFTLLVPKDGSGLSPSTPIDRLMTGSSLLQKATLPQAEAPRLLRQLACEGVTAATVFPDFNGVVASLIERTHWINATP